MAELLTINDYIPASFAGRGLFSAMVNPPLTVTAAQADILFADHYGEKLAGPLLSRYDAPLTSEQLEEVAAIVLALYTPNWAKVKKILEVQYNPAHNYDMTEHREYADNADNTLQRTTSDTRTDDLTEETTTTNTRTNDLTETASAASNVYGFNSPDAVPATTDTDTTTNTGTASDNGTNNRTNTGTQTNAGTLSDTDTRRMDGSHDLTRSGNIGVTTTQQMLQSEIDLWKWNYTERILEDAQRVLTIPIF